MGLKLDATGHLDLTCTEAHALASMVQAYSILSRPSTMVQVYAILARPSVGSDDIEKVFQASIALKKAEKEGVTVVTILRKMVELLDQFA